MTTKTKPLRPTLDLGGLEALDQDVSGASNNARAGRAPLDMFYPDPNQPRKTFDVEMFAEHLKEAGGVHTAINVRPPDPDGRMMIIHGERRWRGSAAAGFPDIPFNIQDDVTVYDDYSQVAENVQREDLTPMELAVFMQKKVADGDSQTFIAKKLGISKSSVTFHLGFIEAPSFVRELYDSGKCRSVQYLYELGKLAKSHPAEVEAFCKEAPDVTYSTIGALALQLKISKASPSPSSTEPSGSGASAVAAPVVDPQVDDLGGGSGAGVLNQNTAGGAGTSAPPPVSTAAGAAKPPAAPPDPSKIRKPLLLAKLGKDEVSVLLNRRPTAQGMVFIRLSESGEEKEIPFSNLKSVLLTEGA